MPTALEARHWGATYALYRFANQLQLDRVLPPGPREYWKQLEAERKMAPQHLSWMYEPDPWAAKRSVEQRQEKAATRREEVAAAPVISAEDRKAAREFAHAVEVKMSPAMRDLVEKCIKEAAAVHPEIEGGEGKDFVSDDKLAAELEKLGFKIHHIRRTLVALSSSSPLTASLLRQSSPLDAAIQHLVLSCPEFDLPQRFLPANNSSVPFVASTHSGQEDLRVRWMEDRATKEAGFPVAAVKECSADPRVDGTFAHLISILNSLLLGETWTFDSLSDREDAARRDEVRQEEIDALQAVYPTVYYDPKTRELEIPLPDFESDLTLHVLFSAAHPYPTGTRLPAMYVTATDLPPYVRIHLLACVLRTDLGEPDEGRLFGAVEALRSTYETVLAEGPPDMSAVMANLLYRKSKKPKTPIAARDLVGRRAGKVNARARSALADDRTNDDVRKAWEDVVKSEKYTKLLETRQKLPSYMMKDEIVTAVERNRVLVLVGSTGCGKTTQVPQFILDSLIQEGHGATTQILITQPRRVAAMSVASRVSVERAEDGSVGYAVRGESKMSRRTKLLFCTTGVALRRLGLGGDGLEGLTHIIVDEVHERSVDGDFLLLELKDILKRNDKLKIILMSATINQETFSNYFDGAPVLTIPGRTFPVEDIYIEDIIAEIPYKPSFFRWNKQIDELKNAIGREAPRLSDESVLALAVISAATSVDPQLVASVLGYVLSKTPYGGILIFMSGVQEIRATIEAIKASTYSKQVDVLPLHANLTPEEQRLCFGRTARQKVVVSTNVAETSITIDDIVCVIDSGIAKEMRYDAEAGLARLVETRISQSNGGQRRGRAGRTKPGTCFKLYTRRAEQNMRKFVEPEILRVPLDSLSLSVKAMREDEDVKDFLGRAIDPPSMVAMNKAWVNLKALGAVGEDDELTALGKHMATMPLDLQLAKILVMGAIFSCVSPVLTIAACLSSKPLFLSPLEQRKESNSARQRFLSANSDLLTLVAAFDAATYEVGNGGMRNARDFFEANFISQTAFRDISSLREDFWQCLIEIGFAPRHAKPEDPAFNLNSQNENTVKSMIAAGLWPRICRVKTPRTQFTQTQGGTVAKENEARELHFFDVRSDERVFIHPSSALFTVSTFKSDYVAYFTKILSSKTLPAKVYIRDISEIPLYSLLLFGGQITVNHVGGGLTIRTRAGDDDESIDIKLKAWPRIGVLVNFLRRLLDAHLASAIYDPTQLASFAEQSVVNTMVQLLERDGMSG